MKNGLLPLIVEQDIHAALAQLLEDEPLHEVSVNLETQTLTLPDDVNVTFPIDSFNKMCMLEGIDSLEYLLKHDQHISAFESNL